MRNILKRIGLVLLGLLVIIVIALVGLYASGSKRLNTTYTVPMEAVAVPTDAASISAGEHLFQVHCAGCHGVKLEGGVVFSMPPLGTIVAPTIAGGHGKYGTVLSDNELVRAVRHGVGIDQRPLIVMPSGSYYYFSDQDLGQIIAYVKSMPPPSVPPPPSKLSAVGIALMAAGAFGNIVNAETIDHEAPRPAVVEPGVTVAYGEYKSYVGECRICHGLNLSGGKDPNPSAPPAPNLTLGGNLGTWSEDDFIQTLRTGVTPAGKQLSEFMPWKFYGKMNDIELKALYLYFTSLGELASTN
jgi:mono/diheme cytochrome c family protein